MLKQQNNEGDVPGIRFLLAETPLFLCQSHGVLDVNGAWRREEGCKRRRKELPKSTVSDITVT
jgi:hypothetical protein